MIEAFVFCIAILAISGIALYSEFRQVWNSRRLGRLIVRALQPYYGQHVDKAQERLGPPSEIVPGADGRSLYIWTGAHTKPLPRTKDLLIVSMTVDDHGTIEEMCWRTRKAV